MLVAGGVLTWQYPTRGVTCCLRCRRHAPECTIKARLNRTCTQLFMNVEPVKILSFCGSDYFLPPLSTYDDVFVDHQFAGVVEVSASRTENKRMRPKGVMAKSSYAKRTPTRRLPHSERTRTSTHYLESMRRGEATSAQAPQPLPKAAKK